MVQAVAEPVLSMKVDLSISGRKLKDLDFFSKSDPMCILYEMDNGNWKKVGQTEMINNNLNPDFKTTLRVDYWFERAQSLKFVMIDGDGSGDYDTIGEVQTTMGNIMGAKS
jgi:hypothetical protein